MNPFQNGFMQNMKADSPGGKVTQVDHYRKGKFSVHRWGQQTAVPELSSSDSPSALSNARDLSPVTNTNTVKL